MVLQEHLVRLRWNYFILQRQKCIIAALPYAHAQLCSGLSLPTLQKMKNTCVRSGKAETIYTEQQKIFCWFQVYSQLSCSIAEMSQILQRCYAVNWNRDEEQNGLKVFVWCQTPFYILGWYGLEKMWEKTRNYGHWQNSKRISDFLFYCVNKSTTAWQSWLVEGQYPKKS